jgi:glutamate/tyrosine decarboxylase-like PLP-dependent enzyme
MWLHVDGAFGSLIILDPKRRQYVAGIDQVDSLAFDFHKWLHCPYDVGCVLVRDALHLESTFGHPQAYLKVTEKGGRGNEPKFCDMGPELTRSFRALKVWLTLKEHGILKFGQKIAENCEQAQYLISLLEKHKNIIHILRPVSLNIVNFRFEPEHHKDDPELVDTLNSDLVTEIQISGLALPSTTRMQNRLYIRVCIVSHRCTNKDFDIFVDTLFKLYQEKIKE